MLSFQRDHGSNKLPANKQAGAGPGGLPAQVDTGEQEFLTVAARPSSLHRSTALVVILFAIGALCLWFMIKKSRPQAAVAAPAADEQTQIEIAITRLTGVSSEMLSRMDEIVKKFYEFSDVFQVDVDELAKNPFELELFLSNLRAKLDDQQEQQDISAEEVLREQLKKKAASLRLQNVMLSPSGSCCTINGKPLRKGDTIEEFTVTSIGESSVELVWKPQGDASLPEAAGFDLKVILKFSK